MELIQTNLDLCTGCNRCVRECPMEPANVTYQDEAGNIKVRIDYEKCIVCGRCLYACKHNARYHVDDTERFFDDLANGIPISLIAAPAIRTNVPDWKRLFTFFKRLGVNKIYDVSLGADICIWSNIRHVEKNGSVPLITQPCPVIVTYCEMYRHDLLKYLSPAQSPMACASVYMKEYKGITDRIAALSPCVAKANEFLGTGLAQYSITFSRLNDYLKKNKIELPEEQTDFDSDESSLGSIFPMPGGLKENIEFFTDKTVSVDRAEGNGVFKMLNEFAESPAESLPRVFDVLNCQDGCNIGTACTHSSNIFKINREMDNRRKAATGGRKREYFVELYRKYDDAFDLSKFSREYKPSLVQFPKINDDDIANAFHLLNKTDLDKQTVDCGACGSDTCTGMARKIALGVNIPLNCIVKVMEDAKVEHEENMVAHNRLAEMEKMHETDELMRSMLDSNPFGANFWNKNLELIDINEATVNLFKISDKNEYIENFKAFSPEYQPDGRLSNDAAAQYIRNAFKKGSERFEWMHQTIGGEEIPCEITMKRVDYKGDHIVAAYLRDLREHKRMMADIDKKGRLLNIISRLAEVLLTAANEENFEETLHKGMELIGQCLEADCVQIWPNEIYDDTLHFVLRYKWLSDAGRKAPPVDLGTAVPYSKRWNELFLRGEYINGPISTLPQEDQDLLGPLGLMSTITIPLFYRDRFWGVFCVNDCVRERYFTDNEISMLSSAGLMLSNAINRNLQTSQINDTAARLKAVVANYPGAICSADKDFNITLFDGLLVPHLIDKGLFFTGQDLNKALQKDEYKHILLNLKKTISEGPQDWSFEANDKALHMATMPIFNDKGEATGLVAKIEDVTEMSRIQKELKIALEKAKAAVLALEAAQLTTSAMFESNPQINILFDLKFNALDCNPAAIEFMGFKTKADMLAGVFKRITESIPAFQANGRASIPLSERLVTAAKKGYLKIDTDLVIGGVQRSLNVEIKRIPYESSHAFVCYIHDMTDIRARERELISTREQNEIQLTKLNMVLKTTRIGLWDMAIVKDDPVNLVNTITWSDEFRHLLGYEEENDFPNQLSTFNDCLHPDDREKTYNILVKHLMDKTGKTPFDVEYRLLKKDGEYSYFRATGETIRDESGGPIHIAGSLIDITETKNILLDSEKQKLQAEAANQAKSLFLSTMSHEIRTPMNAILGITEIQLQSYALEPSVKEGFEKIRVSGDMLLNIINDILDLSKIEAGKLELVTSTYETASLISDTAQLNMMRIGSKPIEFELYVDENLPATLLGDELRVKQILNNILSNAFKYTDAGKVIMSVSSKEIDGSDDKMTLVVNISDSGQGMTKEQVEKLFDEYARFNHETNRTTEGTGLGMSITRNLIQMMNGEIAIESELGKGSVVTVFMPQGKVDSDVLGKGIVNNLQKFRTSSRSHMKRVQVKREPMPYGSVLIVDDVETNIYVAKGLLAPYELKITSADSGFAAIEKIMHGNVYDIVFMDHMMPVMDGIEATKKLREMGYGKPIVALTANAVAGQAEIFLENGFDDFISKPIDIRQLNTILNKLIRDKQPPEVVAEARQRAGIEKPDIPQPAQIPMFSEIFVRDANKSIAVLDEFIGKGGQYSEEEIRTYIIHTHGIKSALANIGEMELSAVAQKLEQFGRDDDIEAINAETPAFLDSIRIVVGKLTPREETVEIETEDTPYLTEKMLAIKAACMEYDGFAAEEILTELRQKTWSRQTKKLLETVSEKLLHSAFDEIIDALSDFVETGEVPYGNA